MVYLPNRTKVFTCVADDAQSITWMLNGMKLNETSLYQNLEVGDTIGTGTRSLTINSAENFNGTTIECVASLTSGDVVYSRNTTILIQGKQRLTIMK